MKKEGPVPLFEKEFYKHEVYGLFFQIMDLCIHGIFYQDLCAPTGFEGGCLVRG